MLPGDGSELVLVVDQLEEIFTLLDDEDRRLQFLSLLAQAVTDPSSRVRVVVTLRADFYDRPLLYRGFAALLRDRVETVLPLSPEEIERAVAGPAERVGLSLEQGLLAEIVADVVNEPGALPLLQYALTELFDRRERDGAHAQRRTGDRRVAGALARTRRGGLRRARRERQGARPGSSSCGSWRSGRARTLAAASSVVSSTRSTSTRRRWRAASTPSGPPAALVRPGSATAAPTVEVAHEALLEQWDRLAGWIDEARDDLRTHRRLVGCRRASGRQPAGTRAFSSAAAGSPGTRRGRARRASRGRSSSGSTSTRALEERTTEAGRRGAGAPRARARAALPDPAGALVAVLAIAALVAAGLDGDRVHRERPLEARGGSRTPASSPRRRWRISTSTRS